MKEIFLLLVLVFVDVVFGKSLGFCEQRGCNKDAIKPDTWISIPKLEIVQSLGLCFKW